MESTAEQIFLDFSIHKLRQYSSEIGKCLTLLDDSQTWWRGGANENAIGNLVLHLCGNVRQRIAAIEGRADDRVREREFSALGGLSRAELQSVLSATSEDAISVLSELPDERLHRQVVTGEFRQTILESIYHMVTHFALHSGQIYAATKRLTGADLNFYKPPAQAKRV